jgi:hypothetical protein
MSKDKVYLVPVNRLAPEFLLRIADQSVTADGDGCCGCEKPFGRAGRIAGAMIALNPGGGEGGDDHLPVPGLCSRLRRGGQSLDPDALTESKPRKEREPRCLQTSESPTSAFPCPIYLMAGSTRSAARTMT